MTAGPHARDASSGYDRVADEFIASRSRTIGVDVVGGWAGQLPTRAAVLDVAAGNGMPLTEVLISTGLLVSAVDASPRMAGAFQQRFPHVAVACAAAQRLPCREGAFDAALAWGLLFLLPPTDQEAVVREVARVLRPGGRFLFTAPAQIGEWRDNLTRLPSVSLGADAYRRIGARAGFSLASEHEDAGDNHYYALVKGS